MALISYLTTIDFDFGALGRLAEHLDRLGVRRPLVVTDHGVVAAGIAARVEAALGAAHGARFDETPENPTEAAVRKGAAAYELHSADGIVAVGGGSSMDLAKAVALAVTHSGALAGYAMVEGGLSRITAAVAPVVAIPTTAGTGSEVGRGAVIVMDDGRKLGLISPHLIPKIALCDPELTLTLPPALTAATGMDAIAHCIETFLSPAVNPPADGIALDGLARAIAWIETAVRDGANREARWNMLMAAVEGALAFQKGLGAVHALSHPLGALPGMRLHHGTLNAVFLPAVLRFNAAHVGDKMRRVASAMGLAPDADVAGCVRDLNRRIGLPAGLAAMGVPREALPAIAEAATRDHCHATNPRPASVADYARLLEESYA
ncbi:MAG: iron-containing alcohol dehydrogenase [Burkholderiales bacterium]|nr:iron-containing alcohol dehydrogenase [Burkholderiales bacterium]